MIKKYKESLIKMPEEYKDTYFMLGIIAYYLLPVALILIITFNKGFLNIIGLLFSIIIVFCWIVAIITAYTIFKNPL